MNAVPPEPTPTYLQLRSRILGLNPTDLGLSPTDTTPHIWGVVIEMNYAVGTATLLSLADGTTSVHYSTGGGLLGRGDYAPVAQASKALVAQAESFLNLTSSAKEFPLPETGQVSFIFLTFTGVYTVIAPAISLASHTHPLTPIFISAQEVLSQLRLLAEKTQK